MKSRLLQYVFRPIMIILFGSIVGYLLLVIVYSLPTEQMKKNMLSGADIYLTEGLEYEYASGYKSSILDNETDGIMLSETVYASGDAISDAILVPRLSYSNSDGSIYSLLGILQNDTSTEPTISTYPNYWHGYLIILKPFYLLFDFADMRMFNLTGVMCVIFLLTALMYRADRQHFLLSLLVMLIYWNPATISMCIQLSGCFYISMLASCAVILICSHQSADRQKDHVLILFLITGILTVYFDFLTYPIVTLCVPLVFWLIFTEFDQIRDVIVRIFGFSIYWAMGYAGMWIMKWVIGTIVTGQNLFLSAGRKLAERSGTDVNGVEITRILAVWTILKTYFKWPYLILTMAVLLFFGFLYLRNRNSHSGSVSCTSNTQAGSFCHNNNDISQPVEDNAFVAPPQKACFIQVFLPFMLVAFIPLVWLFVTANHAYIHPRLTYRDIGASVFAVLSGLSAYICKAGRDSV